MSRSFTLFQTSRHGHEEKPARPSSLSVSRPAKSVDLFQQVYDLALARDEDALRAFMTKYADEYADLRRRQHTPLSLLAAEGKFKAAQLLAEFVGEEGRTEYLRGTAEGGYFKQLVDEFGTTILHDQFVIIGAASGGRFSWNLYMRACGGAEERENAFDKTADLKFEIDEPHRAMQVKESSAFLKGVALRHAQVGAAMGGHLDLLLKFSADKDLAVREAAMAGQAGLVFSLLTMRADVNCAIEGAGVGLQPDLLQYLVQKNPKSMNIAVSSASRHLLNQESAQKFLRIFSSEFSVRFAEAMNVSRAFDYDAKALLPKKRTVAVAISHHPTERKDESRSVVATTATLSPANVASSVPKTVATSSHSLHHRPTKQDEKGKAEANAKTKSYSRIK